MAEPLFDVYDANCPSRMALHRIGDRWTALVVGVLAERPHRFGELRRRIGGVAQKMLTQTLRSLERDGLVSRKAFATVLVTVEYSPTPLGETLATGEMWCCSSLTSWLRLLTASGLPFGNRSRHWRVAVRQAGRRASSPDTRSTISSR
jgi:DNA-binding HxlR family transcriptional regulator